MKNVRFMAVLLSASLLFSSCGTMNNTGKGSLIGGSGGAALGAGLGALIGKDKGKSAAIGAAVGVAVGAGAGALIGRKMDKQKEELEKIQGAEVETVTDANGLQGVKVTFSSGILFPTNGVSLSSKSQTALRDFAVSLVNNPETDITIWGHTDNTGTDAVNERISTQRAQAVATFLNQNGISTNRMTVAGKSYYEPVADNSTVEGRAQNRRVDIYITANENMIKQAEAGTLK
ncbi:OmpA family protein [Coprobacter tertius]|uniref:OmpA family protein n=1 Tax=Coprobacter tertius TaxID=2944915 RepID=A0ABT1MG10_9BACT|nr:OmpA family protein [Coprobacter tertius]MCP9611557.1 OmpA family protein [Coprobacter tertius]